MSDYISCVYFLLYYYQTPQIRVQFLWLHISDVYISVMWPFCASVAECSILVGCVVCSSSIVLHFELTCKACVVFLCSLKAECDFTDCVVLASSTFHVYTECCCSAELTRAICQVWDLFLCIEVLSLKHLTRTELFFSEMVPVLQ